MEIRPWSGGLAAAQDLSKAPSFVLGPLFVNPPLCTLSARGRSEKLEPRVMRVMVTLANAKGSVLSRDDLIGLCWDGQIVGENAINRVLSRLRRVLAELVGGAVRIETINKVGFRLVTDICEFDAESAESTPKVPGQPVHPAGWTRLELPRRRALAALSTAAVLAGASAYWQRERLFGHMPDPRALDLYTRAQALQKTVEPGTMEQAISFYKQAIEIEPDYADAWGALAIGYWHSRSGFSRREQESARQLAASAARRALELDPGQADADIATIMFKPRYRHMLRVERDLRGLLRRHPDYWYGLAQMGVMLREVGRFKDSLQYTLRELKIDPMLPVAWAFLSEAYAYMGDLQQSDLAMRRGTQRWPASGILWQTRVSTLMETGRFREAAAVARDPRARPDYVPEEYGERQARLALALAEEDAVTIAGFRNEVIGVVARDPPSAEYLASTLVLLGAPDKAFDALKRHYSSQKAETDLRFVPRTLPLFSPVMLRLKDDPRHRELLELTGLEDYWQRSGSQPDFRRD
ncbi:MAG: hypothetical protein C0510_02835 [Erythrobacter sp.]|nr:hypothetical protein [Erythrobacter sp.]